MKGLRLRRKCAATATSCYVGISVTYRCPNVFRPQTFSLSLNQHAIGLARGSACLISREVSDSYVNGFPNTRTKSEWNQYPPAPKENRCKPIWRAVVNGCIGCIEGPLVRPNRSLNPSQWPSNLGK